MKKKTLIICSTLFFLTLPVIVFPFELIDEKNVKVDISPQTSDSGNIGFEYVASCQKSMIKAKDGIASSSLGVNLQSSGTIMKDSSENNNQIVSKISLIGDFVSSGDFGTLEERAIFREKLNQLSKAMYKQITRVKEVKKQIAQNEKETTNPLQLANKNAPLLLQKEKALKIYNDLEEKYDKLVDQSDFESKLISLHLNAGQESDQKLENNQFVVGIGISSNFTFIGTSAYNTLSNIIDFPFKLLRHSMSEYNPKLPLLYIGFDYVTDSEFEQRKELTDEMDFTRLNAEIAWQTLILRDILLGVRWEGYSEINAPQEIKDAELDNTFFVEISARVPLKGDETKELFIKWIDGEKPTTVDVDKAVVMGFTWKFQ